ncbi:hypothetical protein N7510_006327 [Penicillium lagena]|uniref:uncharacterized protein n=1 Tax=Penicillium lagena TaxID=94218 RepID=UPI002540A7F6|nr:uncharacterized protein N7510_006327 [Penicillium lagena]KAJ5613133.1 hypothetical protein N7510_006327 [Penicillium lagena]
MSLRRSQRSRGSLHESLEQDANTRTRPTRLTRFAATAAASASVTVSRPPSDSSGEPTKHLRLTVRMPAGKLREATTGGRPGRRNVNVFRENPIVSGPRTSRTRKRLVEVNTSDEEDDDDQEEEDEIGDEEDAPGEDDDEDADADGDVDMDDAPPQAPIRRQARAAAARGKAAKSVEAKEMELEEEEDDEEEEVEEEEDEDEEEEEEEEEAFNEESDAVGEPDDVNEESAAPDETGDALDLDEEDEVDDDMDSDALLLDSGRQTTKRQRGNLGDDFLQLPMEPQVKKHLTAEERAMRRTEMARRRKNLSEKRNEEEKMDTINRLLKKQAPKRRGRVSAAEGTADVTPGDLEAQEQEKADATFVRWISGPNGCSVSVPEEWLGTPAGRIFGAPSAATGKLVEEL